MTDDNAPDLSLLPKVVTEALMHSIDMQVYSPARTLDGGWVWPGSVAATWNTDEPESCSATVEYHYLYASVVQHDPMIFRLHGAEVAVDPLQMTAMAWLEYVGVPPDHSQSVVRRQRLEARCVTPHFQLTTMHDELEPMLPWVARWIYASGEAEWRQMLLASPVQLADPIEGELDGLANDGKVDLWTREADRSLKNNLQ